MIVAFLSYLLLEDDNLARKLHDFPLINLLCTIGPRETYSRRKGHFEILNGSGRSLQSSRTTVSNAKEMCLRDVHRLRVSTFIVRH